MIQLEEIHIEEFRGIRKLTLAPNRKSFAVQGPNGSGKSGVVDAIEFGLTGDISRLGGTGTRGLSVKKHAPHVDASDMPASAFVRLKLFLPRLEKSVTLTRSVKNPSKPKIEPPDSDVMDVLNGIAKHPEIALSRRQIIRYILTEATNRSKDVQTLLRLDEIDKTRLVMKKSANLCENAKKQAGQVSGTAAAALQRHLGTSSLSSEQICSVVNERRVQLSLLPIDKLTPDTPLGADASNQSRESTELVRSTAERDIQALRKALADEQMHEHTSVIAQQLAILDASPNLQLALRSRQLVELGLKAADDDQCPLCDTEWDLETLRAHLLQKLERSEQAAKIDQRICHASSLVSSLLHAALTEARSVIKVAKLLQLTESMTKLESWSVQVELLCMSLRTHDGLASVRKELSTMASLIDLDAELNIIDEKLRQLPDRSAIAAASGFLAVAQERMTAYQRCKREEAKATQVAQQASDAYRCYCDAAESALETLYADVEQAFTDCYRIINGDDEEEFTAKLTPADGKLELDVDFYNRGLFHPGAYHSEGHQDGMGLCLYLALMQQVFGDDLRLVILDDVVMSVDSQHRRLICQLLKDRFPDTQFIITTHEKAWFKQMQASCLIGRQSGVTFGSWSVDAGPMVNDITDPWEDIDTALKRGEMDVAAARLRRHMEYVCSELAEGLVAQVGYRPDGNYEFGELLQSVKGRLSRYAKDAANVAAAWQNEVERNAALELGKHLSACWQEIEHESWVVNPAVHYNPWENFVKADFMPVVDALRQLLDCFCCPRCQSWLRVTSRHNPDAIRCDCGKTSFNLKRPRKNRQPTVAST